MAKDQVCEEQKESIRTMLGAGHGVKMIARTIGCYQQVVRRVAQESLSEVGV